MITRLAVRRRRPVSAGRMVAAAVVALTFAMNVGTLWVFFGVDYLSRYRVPGITDFDVLVLDFAIAEFVAVTLSYVLVGFLLAGRPGAGRDIAGVVNAALRPNKVGVWLRAPAAPHTSHPTTP